MPHLSAGLQSEVLVALGCLTVPGALVLGAVLAGSGRRHPRAVAAHLGWLSPTAGFVLLMLVAVDLAPDAVRDNAESGAPLLQVLLPAALTFAAASVVLWRPTPVGCCSRATGMVTALVLVGHGILEGFVVGLGVGAGLATGLGLLALYAGHRFAEGFALGATLQPASRPTRALLVALAAVTPLVGGDAGLLASPGPRLSVIVTAALAGLLGAAGLRLLAGPSVVSSDTPGSDRLVDEPTGVHS